jgi:hypothetical protein
MGGRVAKKLGDGLMSLFGYPVAHENDAERAARAALAIQGALVELEPQESEYRQVGAYRAHLRRNRAGSSMPSRHIASFALRAFRAKRTSNHTPSGSAFCSVSVSQFSHSR